jgi:hypothetical protein
VELTRALPLFSEFGVRREKDKRRSGKAVLLESCNDYRKIPVDWRRFGLPTQTLAVWR